MLFTSSVWFTSYSAWAVWLGYVVSAGLSVEMAPVSTCGAIGQGS